eukprot:368002-Pelagomonas_calceolata.AAC.1
MANGDLEGTKSANHAARTVRPSNPSTLHAAFIDFKQAYDTIPRETLWQHLRRISIPTSLLSVIQEMYADGLDVYARKKHIIINTVKSEVVHFIYIGNNLPAYTIGSDTLAHKDSFKYLGMMFYRTLNMAESAEIASRAMLTSAYRICRFAREHTLAIGHMLPRGLFLGCEANYHKLGCLERMWAPTTAALLVQSCSQAV